MQASIKPLLHRVYEHPFNLALAQGTLPLPLFRNFLEQDQLYLLDFSRALRITSLGLKNLEHRKFLYYLGIKIIHSELYLNQKYLTGHSPYSLFAVESTVEKTPATRDYTAYLLKNAVENSVNISLAGLVPCFYLYSELGLLITNRLDRSNPYKPWIESYSNPSFLTANLGMINIVNTVGASASSIEQEAMIEAFFRSTEYEIDFWDSALRYSASTSPYRSRCKAKCNVSH